MKVVAIFEVDEEKLNEIETGGIEAAFGWMEDSGVYYQDYQYFDDNEKLPDITNYHEKEQENER